MSDSTSKLTFEIGDVEYTAILSDADDSGGVRVSVRLPDDKVVLITKPYEIFHIVGRGGKCCPIVCLRVEA
jgi:hypothetical protein